MKTRRHTAGNIATAALAGLAHGARIALQNRCFLCGNMSHQAVCETCERDALASHFDAAPRCDCCASTLEPPATPRCAGCIAHPPAFDATLAWADYSAPHDSMVLALKFAARLDLARWFARKLALLLQHEALLPALIVPVPLAPGRLAQRGYNQSWEIARALARMLGTRAWARALVRTRETAPQSSLPDARSRGSNVRDAFAAMRYDGAPWRRRAHDWDGLHVAVVDDVMTSGATLDAIARQLKRAGAARVTNLVALRTARETN